METSPKPETVSSSLTIETILNDIAGLEKQRKQLVAEDNIFEASKTNKKIEKLKKALKAKKKQEINSKFAKDKKTTDDAHSAQLNKFNSEWGEKKKKLLQRLKQEEEKIKEKFKEQKSKLKENIFKSFPAKPNPDQHHIELKQIKEALIKQKEYDKAVEIDAKLKAYVSQQQIRHEEAKNFKLLVESERLEKNFERDLENFAKRKNLEIFEFERNKSKEMESLDKRYKNTSRNLMMSQKTLKKRLNENENILSQTSGKEDLEGREEKKESQEKSGLEETTVSQVN